MLEALSRVKLGYSWRNVDKQPKTDSRAAYVAPGLPVITLSMAGVDLIRRRCATNVRCALDP